MGIPGNCLYNHEERKLWLDIPKNASKSVSKYLLDSGWSHGNYIEESIFDYQSVVVVRDVLDRWKGSTIEVCYHKVQSDHFDFSEFETWFEEKKWKNFIDIGDLHHKPLSFFVHKNLQNIVYVPMDSLFETRIMNICGETGTLGVLNSTKENIHKLKIEKYVDELLSDKDFVSKIYDYYKEDQHIFEKVALRESCQQRSS